MNEGVDMFANANATKANATRIQPAAALNCFWTAPIHIFRVGILRYIMDIKTTVISNYNYLLP